MNHQLSPSLRRRATTKELTPNMRIILPTPTVKASFEQLAILEPALNELLATARAHRGRCANAVWYGPEGLRKAMQRLVGHLRGHGPAVLQTSAAYDVAYRTLYAALPDCDGCGCLTLADVI